MTETKVICDKCKKPILDGTCYSEIQIISKYKPITTPKENFSFDILFGAARMINNDIKLDLCPECAAKIKEDILSDSK